ncbi:MAG: hypothetical protein WCX31_21715 [Salinivirgaceae bacterium]
MNRKIQLIYDDKATSNKNDDWITHSSTPISSIHNYSNNTFYYCLGR